MTQELWLDWSHYPVAKPTQEAFENYFLRGLAPGSFTKAVICNNFVEACSRADHWNSKDDMLKTISKWLYNIAPAGSWGSVQAYEDWMNDVDNRRSEFYDYHEKKRVWNALNKKV